MARRLLALVLTMSIIGSACSDAPSIEGRSAGWIHPTEVFRTADLGDNWTLDRGPLSPATEVFDFSEQWPDWCPALNDRPINLAEISQMSTWSSNDHRGHQFFARVESFARAEGATTRLERQTILNDCGGGIPLAESDARSFFGDVATNFVFTTDRDDPRPENVSLVAISHNNLFVQLGFTEPQTAQDTEDFVRLLEETLRTLKGAPFSEPVHEVEPSGT